MIWIGSSRRRSRGQALVEFALVAPLLFVLLFGIIEGGRLLLYYHSLNNAVQRGNALRHRPRQQRPLTVPPVVRQTGPTCTATTSNRRSPMPPSVSSAWASWASRRSRAATAPTASTTRATAQGRSINGDDSNKRGSDVTLFVTFTYSPILPLIPPITISAESTLVINN
jgi:Flp pilus assembly protein TadG